MAYTKVIITLCDATRRLARVLLKYADPKNKADAMNILHSRIGVYSVDNSVIKKVAESYFSAGSMIL